MGGSWGLMLDHLTTGSGHAFGSFTLIQYTVSHSPCRSLALLVSATPNIFVFLNLASPNRCRYSDSKGVFSGDVYMMCLRTPLRKHNGGKWHVAGRIQNGGY